MEPLKDQPMSWTYAGLADEMANHGDYITLEAGVHRLFVIRDDTGCILRRSFEHRVIETCDAVIVVVESEQVTAAFHGRGGNPDVVDGNRRAGEA